jgi:O-antigen/teichoic acid export membrane protein
MSYLRTLAKETVIYGGSSILARALQYVLLTPYLTRKLVNLDYGRHAIYYALAAVLIILFTFRFETAFFRFGHKQDQIERSFSTAAIFLLALALAYTTLLWFNAEHIAGLFTLEADARYVRWFALIIAADALAALPFARLRLENRPIRFAVIKTFSMLVNILGVILLLEIWPTINIFPEIQAAYNPSIILDYVFLANLIASVATLMLLSPYFFQTKWTFDFALWRRMLAYSWPLLIVGLAGTVNLVFDSFFLSWFLPGTEEENIAQTGVYKACMRIAILMNLISQAYNYAAEPFFFKQIEAADAKEKYARTAQAFAWVGCFSILAIGLHLEVIKHLIDESKWGMMHLVPLMLVAYLFLGMYYNFAVWYKVSDRTKYGAVIATIGAVLTILGLRFLIPVLGPLGAVLTTLVVFFVLASLTYLWGRRVYPIPYNLGRMGHYLLSAVGLYVLSIGLENANPPSVILWIFRFMLLIAYVWIWVRLEAVGPQLRAAWNKLSTQNPFKK